MPEGLRHHRAGAGEPLLLIHGLGSRWQLWEPVLPVLSEHYDVVAVDLPGFGGSTASGASTVEEYANFLAAEFGPCHVAGSSLGGGIALELGRRGVARSVTAFAPIGFWGPLGRRWCQASITACRWSGRLAGPALPLLARSAAGRAALFGLFFGHPAKVDPVAGVADARALVAAPGFTAARDAFARHRFPADPGRLPQVPVTVVWGSRDRILPARQARRAAAELPFARHEILAGAGHLPFADAPGDCVRLVRETAVDNLPITG
ncbi:alpha/beta fold hydrolase [Hamadaea tsunoensis]|uniref:alpha/beta fold hydrolase n=1 Tax=Hamadaea tsunoensis TaxID=53368 RepID=UPI0004051494|nr:alpha/beta fold hydrolase [Hamadaea tsunoensis]